jgi:hypothetical protein
MEVASLPRKINVILGEKFNRLTVIQDLGQRQIGSSGLYQFVQVECECGIKKEMLYTDVRSGHNKSCGCYNLEQIKERMTVHGHSDTRLYRIWKDMRRRCNNPKRKNYPDYGGRGIRVCEDWNDFINFYNWSMEHGYTNHLTIERIDVNGNYEPSNCEWIIRQKQNGNTRKTKEFKAISPNGDIFLTKNVREFSRIHNLDRNEVSNCLNQKRETYKGWIFELVIK